MNKLLTIVIPAYNMEHYLDKCVSSLLSIESHLWRKTEIIVVNDGSNDNTSLKAHSYCGQYPDVIKVIDKDNGNYGSCINAGLACALGKYIKVLDADDWFDTGAYASFLNQLESLDVDLIVTEYNKVDANGMVLFSTHHCNPKKLKLTTLDSCHDYWSMHSLCYRTELLRNHRYEQTTGISYTDTEWSIIPLMYVKQIAILPDYLYQYLVGRDGQTMESLTTIISVFLHKWDSIDNNDETHLSK